MKVPFCVSKKSTDFFERDCCLRAANSARLLYQIHQTFINHEVFDNPRGAFPMEAPLHFFGLYVIFVLINRLRLNEEDDI